MTDQALLDLVGTPASDRLSNAALVAQRHIAGWLLGSVVQRADGSVAGWVDPQGRAAYVYPEIVGYYLQWLAWYAARADDHVSLARRARAAQQWLTAWIGGPGPPPTRVHAVAGAEDWRNRAVFSFDLAMVLRGLAAADGMHLLVVDPMLLGRLTGLLEALIADDGNLDACRVHRGDAVLPMRWSTQRGPFLAKAAAGIEIAARSLPGITAALRAAARKTFDASVTALTHAPHAETHPQLYALEGYLAWPDHPHFDRRIPEMMSAFDRIIAATLAHGRVPESLHEAGPARLDIVAQVLRVGVLLGHHGHRTMPGEVARPLVAELETAVLPDGAMPFARHGDFARQRNAWVAMFATQALAWIGSRPSTLRHVAKAPAIV